MPNYTFTFTDQEVQVILEALADTPFRKSAPVINNIQQQASAQVEKPEEEEPVRDAE